MEELCPRKMIPRRVVLLAVAAVINLHAGPLWSQTLTVGGPDGFKTLQEALTASVDGDTVKVLGGRHEGSFLIDRSIRLEGEERPIIDGQGRGTVIRVNAPQVEIRGFVIQGSGDRLSADEAGLTISAPKALVEMNEFQDVLFGIDLRRAPGSIIRENHLSGKTLDISRRGDLIRVWYSDDVTIERNRTDGGRDAVLWYSSRLIVRDNVFRKGRYGVHFMYCRSAEVTGNRLENNSVGAYLMYSEGLKLSENRVVNNRGPSGFGIGFKDMKDAVIEGNAVVSNRVGLYLDGCEGMMCKGNWIVFNDVGADLMSTARLNAFRTNNIIENGEQVLIDASSTRTVNEWSGNYWSDYRGYDAAGDGTGDRPHRGMKLFERLMDRFGLLRIFLGSPSAQAIDHAASVFPVFAPVPKFEDPAPAMDPHPLALPYDPAPMSWGWFAVSAAFLLPVLGMMRKGSDPASSSPRKHGRYSGRVEPPLNAAMIRAKAVSKRYKKVQALSSVDLEVRRGETIALWGRNGAGKTTLLRCLLGIIPFEGEVRIAGLEVRKDGCEAREWVGYVPQEIRLHQDQSVWETLNFYARLRRVERERIEKLLNEWGLSSARHQMVQNLSGGMKQKLTLIIALLSDPPLMFLDEPTSHLDAVTRREFHTVLEKLKAAGKTIIFCTHRASEVRKYADRVLVLEAGVVMAQGAPEGVRNYLSRRSG